MLGRTLPISFSPSAPPPFQLTLPFTYFIVIDPTIRPLPSPTAYFPLLYSYWAAVPEMHGVLFGTSLFPRA